MTAQGTGWTIDAGAASTPDAAGWVRQLRAAPVSLFLVVLNWTVLLARSGRHAHVVQQGAAATQPVVVSFNPLHALYQLVAPPNLLSALVVTVALLTLGVIAERRLGAGRYVLAVVAGQLVGNLLTAALAWLAAPLWQPWAVMMRHGWSGGAATASVGALIAASGGFPRVWSRRVRLGFAAFAATVLLYDGDAASVVTFGAIVTGFLLGLWFWRAHPRRGAWVPQRESRRLVATVVACAALGPILAAYSATAAGPIRVLGGLVVTGRASGTILREICWVSSPQACAVARIRHEFGPGTAIMTVLPSLLLMVLCLGLRRGRRDAYWASMVMVLAMLVVTQIAFVWRPLMQVFRQREMLPPGALLLRMVVLELPLLVPCAVLGTLVATRELFSQPIRWPALARTAMRCLVALLAGAFAYVVIGLIAHLGWLPPANPAALGHDAAVRMLGLDVLFGVSPQLMPTDRATRLLFQAVGPLTAVAVLAIITRALRPPMRATPPDRQRMRDLIMTTGGSNLAWMNTWAGNRHWFSRDGHSAVAYRVARGFAVTVTEPVGDGDPLAAILEFTEFCDRQGLTPCFYSTGEDFAAAARDAGWQTLQIAEEACVALGTVAFTGKRFQDQRTALNRARREDIRVEWSRYSDLPSQTQADVRQVMGEWQRDRALPPLGFTLGDVREMEDDAVRCELALDSADRVQAVASWLPIYRQGQRVGWTLDVMRRRTDGFKSGMELLLTTAILKFQEEGCRVVSLSGSPLARVERPGDAPAGASPAALNRAIALLSTALEPFYGFRTLHAFKAKFAPQFRPMFLVYPDPLDLPAIGQAIAEVYLMGDADSAADVGWLRLVGRTLRPSHQGAKRSEVAG